MSTLPSTPATSNKYAIVELIAVMITGIAKFIFVDVFPLKFWFIITAGLFWLSYIILKVRKDYRVLANWGFSRAGFTESLKIVLPVACLSLIAFVSFGLWNNSLILNWHIIPIMLLYPLWGTIQQFLVMGLVAKNLAQIKQPTPIHKSGIILISSTIFAAVHYPSIQLIVGTFFLAIFYTLVFLKHHNL